MADEFSARAATDGPADAPEEGHPPEQSRRGRGATRPSEIPRAGWRDIGKRVMGAMKDDHVPVIAAGVAFYAWLALIPALIAVVMVYGLIASPQQVTSMLQELTAGLSPDAAGTITEIVRGATGAEGLGLGVIVALLGVLWTASGGMDGLIKGVNIAYGEDPRSFPRRRGLALLLTLGAIVAAIVAVALIAVFPIAIDAIGLGAAASIGANVLRWVLLALVAMGGFAVVYRVAPHRAAPKFRWVSWGAVGATVLWLLGSWGFALFVQFFGSYNATYGALAGVIVLNLWLFLSAFVALLGAEVNSEMEAQTRRDTTTGESDPMGQRGAVKADQLGVSATDSSD